ncbi:hypothetical protein E1211_23560 [Micromonospora sp. 15K316]|uniref:hypothetical protein n=1 Tax=Micromonospora sp. 15K316 TaxID=2530376 RepID=UPI001053D27D|nr:hypothetical protein [Micromonospora sp. 15K316]TDC30801.1 hypothetical protein E1211_23560 [Micromonospora sp. 15K316]
MRLTVGPLAPAVYWRRRAVVLGAGLLFLIVLLYSCTGSGNTGDKKPQAGASSSSSVSPSPTQTLLTPKTGAPPPETSESPDGGDESAGAPTSQGDDAPTAPANGGSNDGSCADAEIKVTPVALPASVGVGASVDLQLRIKNISDRTCSRDVGASLQEIFIKSGAEKIWSSDTCGQATGSDVKSFTPNIEHMFQVTWNGRDTTRCADGLAAGPQVQPGTYQVFARVDTKLSEPLKLTVNG